MYIFGYLLKYLSSNFPFFESIGMSHFIFSQDCVISETINDVLLYSTITGIMLPDISNPRKVTWEKKKQTKSTWRWESDYRTVLSCESTSTELNKHRQQQVLVVPTVFTDFTLVSSSVMLTSWGQFMGSV